MTRRLIPRSVVVSMSARRTGGVVVPDRGGEGEDALLDAGDHAAGSVAAVLFRVELAACGALAGPFRGGVSTHLARRDIARLFSVDRAGT